jgi:prophage regulatory protein
MGVNMTKPLVLLRQDEVCRRVGLTRRWIWQLEREGKFPKRVKVSLNRIGWLENEVDAWIEAKASER